MKIQCFIFNWKGQYENALKLEKELKNYVDVIVVNSDDEHKLEHWKNIGDEYYFSAQFRVALNLFDPKKYDCFWHIQSDASSDQFKQIIDSAKNSFEKYKWGVYAPNVDDTFYIPSRTDIIDIENGLKLVATTDNTCWFIHKDFIEEMINHLDLMNTNELGWGWDLLICAFSHMAQRKVIRDYNFMINHPASTGYLKDQAENEMQEMYQKCPNDLKQVIYWIKVDPSKLAALHGINTTKSDEILIYDTTKR